MKKPPGDCAQVTTRRRPALVVAAAMVATMIAASAISGEGVFIVRIMITGACMASPIARLVAVEVVEGLSAALGQRSVVAVTRVIAVIDMAVEVAGAMEPVAGADKNSVHKPIGPVVAVRRAVVGSVVEVAIGADRLRTEGDGDLGWRYARRAKQRNGEGRESEGFEFGHGLSLICWNGKVAGELSLRGRLEAGELSGIHHSTEGQCRVGWLWGLKGSC